MSAATSAEAMGICTSPGMEEDEDDEQAVLEAAIMAAEAMLLVTRATADDAEALKGVSFC